MCSRSSHKDTGSFPSILLARLTRKLGDRKTVEKISSDLGRLYIDLLPEVLKKEIGINVSVSYIGCKSGSSHQLINCLEEEGTLCSVSLHNWSSNFFIACQNSFIIALIECLLGAEQDITKKPSYRPLSIIEIDLAKIILTKIASVLSLGISSSKNFESYLEGPYTLEVLKKKVNKE